MSFSEIEPGEKSEEFGGQKEFDPDRDVIDVITPGGHVREILSGNNDPLFREVADNQRAGDRSQQSSS